MGLRDMTRFDELFQFLMSLLKLVLGFELQRSASSILVATNGEYNGLDERAATKQYPCES
jgi:hypothetical protein